MLPSPTFVAFVKRVFALSMRCTREACYDPKSGETSASLGRLDKLT